MVDTMLPVFNTLFYVNLHVGTITTLFFSPNPVMCHIVSIYLVKSSLTVIAAVTDLLQLVYLAVWWEVDADLFGLL